MRKLIIMVLLMLLVAAPVAMAADGCSGMICDASCSAPCVSVSPSMGDAVLTPVVPLVTPEPPGLLAEVLKVLDAPPKSFLHA